MSLTNEETAKLLGLDEVLHSAATRANTDYNRQIGPAHATGKLDYQDGREVDTRLTVTAFELKTPTPDDRISIRFMHPETVMQADASYYCVPRAWAKANKIIP
jgi:hypothetical protein